MDLLKYKTVTGTDGNASVGIGINLAQVIKVSRAGEQKDYAGFISLSSLDGSDWTFLPTGKRISFGTNFPFVGNETIHIIYKVTI
jgi:hypothetical protein